MLLLQLTVQRADDTDALWVPPFTLEVGRYIDNISPISIYRYRYRIGTLDIGFSIIDIVSLTSAISIIFRYFLIVFPTF